MKRISDLMTKANQVLLFVVTLVGFCAGARAEVYYPKGGVKPSKGKVTSESVVLVTPQGVIARNTTAEHLATFIRRIDECVTRNVPPDAAPFHLRVTATLSPHAKPKLNLSYQENPPRKILQAISDGLDKLPDMRVKTDPVVFEVYFTIRAKP
jgi:hypothetical protein